MKTVGLHVCCTCSLAKHCPFHWLELSITNCAVYFNTNIPDVSVGDSHVSEKVYEMIDQYHLLSNKALWFCVACSHMNVGVPVGNVRFLLRVTRLRRNFTRRDVDAARPIRAGLVHPPWGQHTGPPGPALAWERIPETRKPGYRSWLTHLLSIRLLYYFCRLSADSAINSVLVCRLSALNALKWGLLDKATLHACTIVAKSFVNESRVDEGLGFFCKSSLFDRKPKQKLL